VKKLLAFGALALLATSVAAQNTVPSVPFSDVNTLIPVVPQGAASAKTVTAPLPVVTGVHGYANALAAVTAWTHTFSNAEEYFMMQPSGTLANGTIITAPSPGDGQRECFFSTQTQSSITWTANTGQTLSGAPTAGVANTPVCMIYDKADAAWYRSP